jgi:hypothetical protein
VLGGGRCVDRQLCCSRFCHLLITNATPTMALANPMLSPSQQTFGASWFTAPDALRCSCGVQGTQCARHTVCKAHS